MRADRSGRGPDTEVSGVCYQSKDCMSVGEDQVALLDIDDDGAALVDSLRQYVFRQAVEYQAVDDPLDRTGANSGS